MIGFAFPKDSPYMELFQSRIEVMKESGVFDRLAHTQAQERHQYSQCEEDLSVGYEEIGFSTIYSSFNVLLTGILLAAVFCIKEHLMKPGGHLHQLIKRS